MDWLSDARPCGVTAAACAGGSLVLLCITPKTSISGLTFAGAAVSAWERRSTTEDVTDPALLDSVLTMSPASGVFPANKSASILPLFLLYSAR